MTAFTHSLAQPSSLAAMSALVLAKQRQEQYQQQQAQELAFAQQVAQQRQMQQQQQMEMQQAAAQQQAQQMQADQMLAFQQAIMQGVQLDPTLGMMASPKSIEDYTKVGLQQRAKQEFESLVQAIPDIEPNSPAYTAAVGKLHSLGQQLGLPSSAPGSILDSAKPIPGANIDHAEATARFQANPNDPKASSDLLLSTAAGFRMAGVDADQASRWAKDVVDAARPSSRQTSLSTEMTVKTAALNTQLKAVDDRITQTLAPFKSLLGVGAVPDEVQLEVQQLQEQRDRIAETIASVQYSVARPSDAEVEAFYSQAAAKANEIIAGMAQGGGAYRTPEGRMALVEQVMRDMNPALFAYLSKQSRTSQGSDQ